MHLIMIAFSAFVLFIPQFAYWKLVSGHFVFYSYTDEHFFFTRPHLVEGLVGFRKGWLIYTPVMIFAMLGLIRTAKIKEWALGMRMFTLLNIYIVLSWWCWWYGGSFGARSFIDSYALLSVPLASYFTFAFSKRLVFSVTIVITLFFISLNIYQTMQYKHGVIHFDSMTNDSYQAIFLKEKRPDYYFYLICHPDYYNAKLGIPERGDCILHDHNNP